MLQHNKDMKAYLKQHGIEATPKRIDEGSMRGVWRLYDIKQYWTDELRDSLDLLGFLDFDGKPWDSEHPVIVREGGAWKGDVPDGGWPAINEAEAGSKFLPFIMHQEGVAHMWGPGRAEGPLPEVYEPWESPLDVNLMTGVANDTAGRGTPGFNDPACYVG